LRSISRPPLAEAASLNIARSDGTVPTWCPPASHDGVFTVPRSRPPYPDEFRREALQMLRAGRSPRELAEALAPPSRRCATGGARTSVIAASATTA
jgi:hypothetical protein